MIILSSDCFSGYGSISGSLPLPHCAEDWPDKICFFIHFQGKYGLGLESRQGSQKGSLQKTSLFHIEKRQHFASNKMVRWALAAAAVP
jgi:hypothetical protein